MTTPTLTCDHCESEIDVAQDPRWVEYRIKRRWRA